MNFRDSRNISKRSVEKKVYRDKGSLLKEIIQYLETKGNANRRGEAMVTTK